MTDTSGSRSERNVHPCGDGASRSSSARLACADAPRPASSPMRSVAHGGPASGVWSAPPLSRRCAAAVISGSIGLLATSQSMKASMARRGTIVPRSSTGQNAWPGRAPVLPRRRSSHDRVPQRPPNLSWSVSTPDARHADAIAEAAVRATSRLQAWPAREPVALARSALNATIRRLRMPSSVSASSTSGHARDSATASQAVRG